MPRGNRSAAAIPGPESAMGNVRTAGTARELAYVVLAEYAASSTFVNELFDGRAAEAALPPEDRRLAMEISYGVVRRQATLDALIRPHVRRPRSQIEPGLWTLLQMGTYQLALMTAVPSHAAVHETVETARSVGEPRWTGFINGVLRSIARELTDECGDGPAADAVPRTDGQFRRTAQPVFPDPAAQPVEHFAVAFSFPEWLAARWHLRFGFEETVRIGSWFNTAASLTLRANLLRTSRDELVTALRSQDVSAQPGELPESIRLAGPARVENLPGFSEGWFAVQDEAAMRAAHLLDPRPGETLLDLCAAPGTKTTHIAERMQDRGRIVATDAGPARLALVAENARRLGLTSIESLLIRDDLADAPAGPFDAALVDAPCSNTGVLGKRPDARWRIGPADLRELPELQFRLLSAACQRTRPGGRVVYSTCSIEPEENAGVVARVLAVSPEWRLAEEHEYLPGRPADGAYQALLIRS